MENDPFIDDLPIKATIQRGFSMAMLNNQMVLKKNSQRFFTVEDPRAAWAALLPPRYFVQVPVLVTIAARTPSGRDGRCNNHHPGSRKIDVERVL